MGSGWNGCGSMQPMSKANANEFRAPERLTDAIALTFSR